MAGGVCTLPDDTCGDGAACGGGRLCVAGECFDACTSGACPLGGTCAGPICVRPSDADAGSDASTPDADGDGGSSLPAHRPCATAGDCVTNEVCGAYASGLMACHLPCGTSAECSAGGSRSTSVCARLDLGSAGTRVCSIPCDPFDDAGCALGDTCDLLYVFDEPVGNVLATECRAIGPAMLGHGASCGTGPEGDPSVCAPGHGCQSDFVATPWAWTCRQICSVGGTRGAACPGSSVCVSAGVEVEGTTIGFCSVP